MPKLVKLGIPHSGEIPYYSDVQAVLCVHYYEQYLFAFNTTVVCTHCYSGVYLIPQLCTHMVTAVCI